MIGSSDNARAPFAGAEVVDLFETVAEHQAKAAGKAARDAANAMVAALDRFRLTMPSADLAEIMSIEALAMVILDAALTTAQAAAERGADEERTFGKFRALLSRVDDALSDYQPIVERQLLDMLTAQSA